MTAELVRTQIENPEEQVAFGSNVARHIKEAIDKRDSANQTEVLGRPKWKTKWEFEELLERMEERFVTARERVDFLIALGLELDVTDTTTQTSLVRGLLIDVDYPTRSLELGSEDGASETVALTHGRYREAGDGLAIYRGGNLFLTLKLLSYGEGEEWAFRH